MKRLLALLVAITCIFSLAMTSYAKNLTTEIIEDNAAYVKGNVFLHSSMIVNGSIYSVGGNVTFDNAGGNIVNGNITVNKMNKIIIPQYSKPEIAGEQLFEEETSFPYNSIEVSSQPSLEKTVESYTAGWYPTPQTITESAYIKSITVNSTMPVDTTSGDVYIVTDNLNIQNSGQITVTGDHKLYLFINNSLTMNGSTAINANGKPSDVSLFIDDSINIGGAAKVNANLYSSDSSVTFGGSGTLNGNIISTTKEFKMQTKGTVNGALYMPEAEVILSGSANINGVVICDSLEMYGNAKIDYKELDFEIPEAAKEYLLEVTPNIAEAGTIHYDAGKYLHGQKAKITVEANKGYTFKKFINNNDPTVIPDTNGEVEIVADTYLMAVFAEETPEIALPDNSAALIPSNDVVRPNISNSMTNEYGYIFGYWDNYMGATEYVTRGEACAMLHRLVKQNDKLNGYTKPTKPSFSDLTQAEWYYTAVEFMNEIGVYNDNDGQNAVAAETQITRGEAAKLFAFTFGIKTNTNACFYDDLDESNPFYKYINALTANGLMVGDAENNHIRPNDRISRAEFVKMYNIVIGRDEKYDINTDVDGNEVICQFKDLLPEQWYYADMMRASNSFTNYKVDKSKVQDRNELDEYNQ